MSVHIDPAFRTYPITRRPTLATIFSSLWYSRPSKSKGCPRKLRCWESRSNNTRGNSLTLVTMKFRFESWHRSAFRRRSRSTSTVRSTRNLTRFAKLSTTRMKCSRISSMTSITHSSRSMSPKRIKTQIYFSKSKSGRAATRPRRGAKPRNWKTSAAWWRAKGSLWSTEKSGKWLSASKISVLV